MDKSGTITVVDYDEDTGRLIVDLDGDSSQLLIEVGLNKLLRDYCESILEAEEESGSDQTTKEP